MNFPLTPLHRLQPVALQTQDGVPAGLFAMAQQELAHVHSVDLSIGGYRSAGCRCQRGEQVNNVDQLIAYSPGRNPTRPPNDARRPVGTLQRSKIATPPGTREAGPMPAKWIGITRRDPPVRVRTVVGGPHNDSVIGDSKRVELIENPTGERIQLHEQVGEITAPGGACILRIRYRRNGGWVEG